MEIRIEGVTFSYKGSWGELPILKGINADIEGPQVVSILGPNGVGKSTLMHCLNKILSPTKGTVFFDGRDVSDYSLKEMAKRNQSNHWAHRQPSVLYFLYVQRKKAAW